MVALGADMKTCENTACTDFFSACTFLTRMQHGGYEDTRLYGMKTLCMKTLCMETSSPNKSMKTCMKTGCRFFLQALAVGGGICLYSSLLGRRVCKLIKNGACTRSVSDND